MNKKGILLYLGVTFGVAYAVEILVLATGLLRFEAQNVFHYALFAALMWVPALGAAIAKRKAPGDSDVQITRWPVPLNPAIRIVVLIPVCFVLLYVLTAYVGWGHPQWNLGPLVNAVSSQLKDLQMQPLTEEARKTLPVLAMFLYPILSITVGATLLAFLAAGNELGWRGYLLQQLLPLGRIPAYLVVGVVWFLWFVPLLIGYKIQYDAAPNLWLSFARFGSMLLVLSVLLGEILYHARNIGLASLALGIFVAQLEGFWPALFPAIDKFWAGPFGLASCILFLLLAGTTQLWLGRSKQPDPEPTLDTPNVEAELS